MKPKAVCLLSGGLDSATCLYAASHEGYDVRALSIRYGQRHEREIECARAIAGGLGIAHEIVTISLPWKGSALLDPAIEIPSGREASQMASDIPVTYVPARNSIFLAVAASWAETEGASAIFIGANALDYSGYPDCRPGFLQAFERMLEAGTRAGVEGRPLRICAPLLSLSKKEIILLASSLGVPFEKTWSCYRGGRVPCGTCDSCLLRIKGFREAGIEDPWTADASSCHS
ncbi:MAG: 7-cyano-7-deazaguanine synthase QueC [Candidatus Omnitrophota bacterium]|jgi:7-cyano-7-deazaguanine synthase